MSATLTIRLDEASAQHLEEASRRSGRSKSDIVRDLIKKSLTYQSTGLDAMSDCVGVLKDAPADLSTNKKYLKDFGRSKSE